MRKRSVLTFCALFLCSTLLFTACGESTPSHEEHHFGKWETVREASCVDGLQTRSCECGETEEQVIPANGSHRYTVQEMTEEYLHREANCQQTAMYFYKCENCDEKGIETFSDNQTGDHSFTLKSNFFVCSEANCESPKLYYYQCSYCGEAGTETYPVGEEYHIFNTKEATDAYLEKTATCQSGAVYHYKCELCSQYGENTYTKGTVTDHVLNAENVCTTCDNHFLYFGEYPQTLKDNDVTVFSETDDRGYYLGNDGCYYARVIANPTNDSVETLYTFSTGEDVVKDEVYYFKVEPICWRILTRNGNDAMIVCDSIIDVTAYNQSSDNNNYESSSLRAWLNAQFLAVAFTEPEQSCMKETVVDNSENTVERVPNPYVCENTTDKIFLLSFKEATDEEYGFHTATRQMEVSDFSLASGCYMSTEENSYRQGAWWYLRSPDSQQFGKVMAGNKNGYFDYVYTKVNTVGVVPAMWITLPNG